MSDERPTCHNLAHSDRPGTRVLMGFWWCEECYWEANELSREDEL